MYCYEVKDCDVETGIKLRGLTAIDVGSKRFPISRSLLNDLRAIRGDYLVEISLEQLSVHSSGKQSLVAQVEPKVEECQKSKQEDRALVLVTIQAAEVSTCEIVQEGDGSSLILAIDERVQGYQKFLHALLVVEKNSPVCLVDSYKTDHECSFWCYLFRRAHYRGGWNTKQLIEFDGQSLTTRFLASHQ